MIEETGYGKINLALAITGRRDDGYHDIDTVFQSIGLCDTITLAEADTFQLTCSDPSLPCDATNLAYKAFAALLPYGKGRTGVTIRIEKRIPVAAGLAGGSADCAAVLRGLNRLWSLGLTDGELCRIGARLGADVPFCLYGGTMRGKGIGEILSPLPPLPPWEVIILHPRVPVYTGKAYALFDAQGARVPVDVAAAAQAAAEKDFYGLTAAMGNTFEELVIPGVPAIGKCRQILADQGLKPLMAGSGPTVFALLPPDIDGSAVYERLLTCCASRQVDVLLTSFAGRKDR